MTLKMKNEANIILKQAVPKVLGSARAANLMFMAFKSRTAYGWGLSATIACILANWRLVSGPQEKQHFSEI